MASIITKLFLDNCIFLIFTKLHTIEMYNVRNLPECVYVGSGCTRVERLDFRRHDTQCGEHFRCYVGQMSCGNATAI